jgi:hypothetical protein
MKNGHFVEGLSNEARFMAALQAVEHRGAPEASWVLVEGDPGYGKTKLLMRHSIRSNAVMVRAKADWTPKWALTDIADVLNVQRQNTTQKQADAVIAELMARQERKGFALIVDEINHASRNVRVLETLRDLTDVSECILIAGGMKGVHSQLKSHKQILSRIDQFVEFTPATVGDVRKMCDQLIPEAKVAEDMVADIQRRTQGRLRLVMGALARVEAFAKRQRGEVTVETFGPRQLVSDERALQLVQAAGT